MPGRFSFRVLQLGALAVVVAASVQHSFDLDRFLVPKELVLHATAFLAALFAFGALTRIAIGKLDFALIAFLGISIISTLFATNHWAAMRALAMTASSLLLFWLARAHAERRSALLHALAIAVVLAAITSLLQAYGLRLDLFASQRAPGGTLGNRNFVAHAAAFGFPLVLLAAMRARVVLFPAIGAAIVAAALVLTRSRAAWLAFAAMLAAFVLTVLLSKALRSDGRTWRRFFVVALFCGAGVAAALMLPNALRWRSDNPYLDSAKDVVNYKEGSGRGRLVQYERSLAMTLRHPILGVGPGNWPVRYPANVPDDDPSLDTSAAGMTFNPWPSSDWIAYLSERGFVAGLLLILVFATFALASLRRAMQAIEREDALRAATLVALAVAAGVVGTFDAVLVLALPAFLLWTALGALWIPPLTTHSPRALLLVLTILLSFAGMLRSGAQLVAMELFERGESLRLASRIDPGNYRLQLRLARIGKRAERCEHARAALDLYPRSAAARAASRGCHE
ncbi:MAG TPA: O-antigen ligase family protein [Thermoanaerobaculia bacterium]|nr:O-antigen ligase family protein [Thermoanaerobaculia bacterium]